MMDISSSFGSSANYAFPSHVIKDSAHQFGRADRPLIGFAFEPTCRYLTDGNR